MSLADDGGGLLITMYLINWRLSGLTNKSILKGFSLKIKLIGRDEAWVIILQKSIQVVQAFAYITVKSERKIMVPQDILIVILKPPSLFL